MVELTLTYNAEKMELAIYPIESSRVRNIVEVVRCKDCKHYHTHNRSAKWDTKSMYCCKSALKKVCPDDFCSYGERREGE